MDDNRLPREALQWDLTAFLAFLWSSSVPLCCVKSHSKAERWKTKEKLERRYSQPIGMTWEEAQQLATSREKWRQVCMPNVFPTRDQPRTEE